jgi:pimeloyl-ACP methyl ester carboxylesterase
MVTPTYTGLGEREHLASPSNDLETHIEDLLAVIKYEDLNDVVLIGHSYGGMVATGVADRARDRIAQVIYLDAFIPRDGQALFDLLPPEQRQRMLEGMKAGDGWRIPPNPCPPDTSEADLKWILPRRLPQSVKSPRHRCGCATVSLSCRAASSIAPASRPETLSANLPNAPGTSLVGATTRSTPAIRRMSRRQRLSPRCFRKSLQSGRRSRS